MAPTPRRLAPTLRAAVVPLLLAGAVAWFAALVTAPVVVGRLHPEHPAFRAAAAVYLAGAVVCHQRADRSFHLGGTRFPVCSRCTGVYTGAVLGLAAAWVWPRRRARALVDRWTTSGRWRVALAAAAAPAALSWLLELAGAMSPVAATWVRAATGAMLGAGVAWAIGMALAAWLAARR